MNNVCLYHKVKQNNFMHLNPVRDYSRNTKTLSVLAHKKCKGKMNTLKVRFFQFHLCGNVEVIAVDEAPCSAL